MKHRALQKELPLHFTNGNTLYLYSIFHPRFTKDPNLKGTVSKHNVAFKELLNAILLEVPLYAVIIKWAVFLGKEIFILGSPWWKNKCGQSKNTTICL